MESGNFAEAQLRALIDVAAVAAGAHRLEDVLELEADHAAFDELLARVRALLRRRKIQAAREQPHQDDKQGFLQTMSSCGFMLTRLRQFGVEPVVAFVDSMRGLSEDDLPAGVTWEAFLGRVRERVTADVERAGAFRFTSQVGLFTCR